VKYFFELNIITPIFYNGNIAQEKSNFNAVIYGVAAQKYAQAALNKFEYIYHYTADNFV
jgi:hypothetical protein